MTFVCLDLLMSLQRHDHQLTHKTGWKVTLSERVPNITTSALPAAFASLLSSVRASVPSTLSQPRDFDWAMHPGGAGILAKAEHVLGYPRTAHRASYDVYVRHGNSSSATVFSVMDRLRGREMDQMAEGGAKRFVVACAFGPGVCVETCMLERGRGRHEGVHTPPISDGESESE